MIRVENRKNETLTRIRPIEGESERLTAARAAVKLYGKKVAYVHNVGGHWYQAYANVKGQPGSYTSVGVNFICE